ncbi:conserved hypothetical protein [Vibrio crassostreae]|nr:conserved hypothetical protein [Vibrio crassostreae]
MPYTYKLICEQFYFIGYEQLFLSRKFRRAIAQTEMHRAWLAGNQGNIGVAEGVLYREWFTDRKHHTNATFKQLWRCISR